MERSTRFEVNGTLKKKLNNDKPISSDTVIDLLLSVGRDFGGYGYQIYELLRAQNARLIRFNPRFLRTTVFNAVVHQNPQAYRDLANSDRVMEERFDEIIRIIHLTGGRHSPWPVYMDTEGSYKKCRNGTNLAMMILFDVITRRVFLLRVDQLNVWDLADVKVALNLYSYRMVTFGREMFLKHQWGDLQGRNGSQLISLLNAADRIGVVVHKTETLSNWTVQRLREDQKQYAAMDVVALHYHNVGTRVQWEYNLTDSPPSITAPVSVLASAPAPVSSPVTSSPPSITAPVSVLASAPASVSSPVASSFWLTTTIHHRSRLCSRLCSCSRLYLCLITPLPSPF
ncbi:hypothetical protein GCK72_008758 [Caenorhabditis remanei]|uniref:3'-5' exonuclease domain-containing protein n=1 Tax=Caenorhabditis remanei TaxID=31234 RepID=A0A6A5H0I7_CAERE|nr:hypothetical protein GCK72_008758 [Caenorhabditis remanei]KAF1760509.1 hypothetical protein GCK72_008758 [Caenorhabditis remanei]